MNHQLHKYEVTLPYMRPPSHIRELQRELMKWVVAREEKELSTKVLHEAIYYLNEFKDIATKATPVSTFLGEKHEEVELPHVNGFVSKI